MNSHKGELAGWTQVRAQQTQAATVLSLVKPSTKAACGVRHLGPSAPRLFTENLLCARPVLVLGLAAKSFLLQVSCPRGLTSRARSARDPGHSRRSAEDITDHPYALSHEPGSDLGSSGWPFRSWSLIRRWHTVGAQSTPLA